MKLQTQLLVLFAIICNINTTFSQIALDLEPFGPTFNNPVEIAHAGDSRLFIVEQIGTIKILNADGSTNSQPFLNINDNVLAGGEQGLLGLAFHPNYSNNGYFFVNYINNSGNTVISRFTRLNENTADPNSELIFLTINQPYTNHNGGHLAFGNDGYLYISSGDGGNPNDIDHEAQNTNSLLGKILRLDIDTPANATNYSFPEDNPFFNSNTQRQEIWAYGLRNPWKFSFDKDNGDLWIADVGQQQYEEINRVSGTDAGVNYGWRCREGQHDFITTNCPSSGFTDPIAEYSHQNNGQFKCSITGGYRYRGNTFPNFNGLYFFADYCSGEIGYLEPNGNNWDMTLTDFTGNWTTFGEDNAGELYVAKQSPGQIYKLKDNSLSINSSAYEHFSIYPNPAKDYTSIRLNNTNPHKVSVFNYQGQLISTFNVTNQDTVIIPTAGFQKGMYIVKVSSTEQTIAKKLIII